MNLISCLILNDRSLEGRKDIIFLLNNSYFKYTLVFLFCFFILQFQMYLCFFFLFYNSKYPFVFSSFSTIPNKHLLRFSILQLLLYFFVILFYHYKYTFVTSFYSFSIYFFPYFFSTTPCIILFRFSIL